MKVNSLNSEYVALNATIVSIRRSYLLHISALNCLLFFVSFQNFTFCFELASYSSWNSMKLWTPNVNNDPPMYIYMRQSSTRLREKYLHRTYYWFMFSVNVVISFKHLIYSAYSNTTVNTSATLALRANSKIYRCQYRRQYFLKSVYEVISTIIYHILNNMK